MAVDRLVDERLRRLEPARLATHYHLATVRRLFAAVQGRSALATDARRLEVLSLSWARTLSWLHARRHRKELQQLPWHEAEPALPELPDLAPEIEAICAAFVDARWTRPPPRWRTSSLRPPRPCSRGSPTLVIGSPTRTLNVAYLVAARVHLFSLTADLEDEERKRRVGLASQSASVFAGALVPDESGEADGSPSEEEFDLYRHLGAMTAQASLDEARPIWQPVLQAGAPAHSWVSAPINDMWRTALALDAPPARFAAMIKEMLAFASEQQSWSGWHSDELQLELLCLSRWGYPRMQERHRPLLAELQPEWTELVGPHMRSSYSARSIIPFLAEPVASDLLATSLDWLAERERQGIASDEDVDRATVDLLAELIGRDATVLVRHPDAAEVLNALVARQNAIALQLIAHLGRNS